MTSMGEMSPAMTHSLWFSGGGRDAFGQWIGFRLALWWFFWLRAKGG